MNPPLVRLVNKQIKRKYMGVCVSWMYGIWLCVRACALCHADAAFLAAFFAAFFAALAKYSTSALLTAS